MFFMMGITEGRKEFAHNQVIICSRCESYGRYVVYMTYTVLSLFFIPCFKWNRQYFVRTTCCGTVYRLNPDIGRRIERGEDVEIQAEHLQAADQQRAGQWTAWEQAAGQQRAQQWTAGQQAESQQRAGQQNRSGYKKCGNCGYTTTEDFEYCPKCGRHF